MVGFDTDNLDVKITRDEKGVKFQVSKSKDEN